MVAVHRVQDLWRLCCRDRGAIYRQRRERLMHSKIMMETTANFFFVSGSGPFPVLLQSRYLVAIVRLLMQEHLMRAQVGRLGLIVAVGQRDRMRQHRRMRTKGRKKSVFGGKAKPAHQLGAQLRLRRTDVNQIMVVRLVWGRIVDLKASIRVR